MKKLTISEVKKLELDMLVRFANYCDNNNLCYTLAGGTLLGAIRHKGFIPWDDDIDIMMPREDYERLLTLENDFSKFGSSRYQLLGRNSIYPFSKIMDMNTMASFEKYDENITKYLWIDIFPIDGLPKSMLQTRAIYFVSRFLMSLILGGRFNLKAERSFVKRSVRVCIKKAIGILGCNKIVRASDKFARIRPFSQAEYVGGISWGYGPQERMPKKEWLERVKVEFEGHEFWAPGCWDLYLRSLYGDYMKLPPEEKRVTHNMVAYVKE